MTGPTTLLVGDRARDALAACGSYEVATVDDAETAIERLEDGAFDCVVVSAGSRSALVTAVERLFESVPGVPVVAVTADHDGVPAAIEAGATDAAPATDPTVLDQRVRNALVRADAGDEDVDADEKIRALHDVATRLETCDTERDIYDVAVEAAEDVLAFDMCYFGVVEDREIRPQATNSDVLSEPVIMTVDEGLAGRTVRQGESYIVDDDETDPDADPVDDSFRAALSIPVGEFGVFQAVSSEYGAFDETDRELGELLVAHVTAAVERVRYEAALRRERDRFAALFEHVPEAAVRYTVEDGEPIVESVNPAFESIFGHDADAAVGESLVDLVVPPDREAEARDHVAALERGETLTKEVERAATDGRREFLLRTAPVDVGEGASGYVIYTDVSDLKRRERALQRQNARLQQFASIVSHDLRNPLNVATGRLEVAADVCQQGREHVEEAREALDRMARLIDDLLALARQGQVVDDPEPVDVAEPAEAAWDGVVTGDATLSVGDVPTLPADEGRVQQLFENLFRNAVEHGSTSSRPEADDTVEHGGSTVHVAVGPLDGGGFYVQDDGPGIPPGEREDVLEHGYTTGEDGTGIGLTIVEQIAEAHGWDVEVTESEWAEGAPENPNGNTRGARFEFRPTN